MSPPHKGHAVRHADFLFSHNYTPLNHGSYGAFPKGVRDYQRDLQDKLEARSDPFIRHEIPRLLDQSRAAAASLLGVSSEEVVIVPNVTTAINTVLRSLHYGSDDVILYLPTTYPACRKTIEYICETTPAQRHLVDITYPIEDDEIIERLRQAVDHLAKRNLKAKVAMFDTVVTFPGVRMPWERLVGVCRELNVLSLVDGAHGIGHIDLTGLGRVKPDFFTSNCYKWLYTPRPSAVFYVPKHNQDLIRSTLPTSHGFRPSEDNEPIDGLTSLKDGRTRFEDLFQWAATVDQTPYLCIPEAVRIRKDRFGGEDDIREYCFKLASTGGKIVAEALGTEVMTTPTGSINQCCFTNVRLPLSFASASQDRPSATHELHADDGATIVKWITEHSMWDYNTWIPGQFYAGQGWVRLSAQIYLEDADFHFAAKVLGELCEAVERGEWKS